jgi:hypothetical protein
MRTTLALLALAVSGAGSVSAQALRATVEGSAVAARVRTRLPTGTVQLSGPLFGGHGTLSAGRLQLDVDYLQGKVNDGPGAPSRDVVEGRASLGFRPISWLALKAGPHARAYVFAGGTQRWLFWEVRARAEGIFIGSTVGGYAELWRAVSADVSVPESFDNAQGGEAGMIVRLERMPLAARIAYRIEHAALGGGSRVETVEGVVVGVVLRRP